VFAELKKLISTRSLAITVVVLDDEQIRVNVVPHARAADSKVNEQIKYSNKSEVASVPEEAIKALTTPISITELPKRLTRSFRPFSVTIWNPTSGFRKRLIARESRVFRRAVFHRHGGIQPHTRRRSFLRLRRGGFPKLFLGTRRPPLSRPLDRTAG
jgi:hypothetical protein